MNGPVEPSSDMRQVAMAMRELYLSLVQSGFTEAQATHLVSGWLGSTGGGDQ